MGTTRVNYASQGQQERELHVWGGVVSARVEDLARELGTTTEAIAQAVEEGEAEPLVDTSRQKKRERDRPTDPSLRSLAFTTEELGALRSAVGEGE